MADGHYGFGRPVGSPADMDEYLTWCVARRRAYAAGEAVPKPVRMLKSVDGIVAKEPTDTPADGPTEVGHPSPK